VVACVAGSHGTEYASIVAMQRLIPRIPAARLSGTVIVVPLINIGSIEQMTPHLNPVDRKSLNGNYPGDSSGTQTQRALFAMTRAVLDRRRRRRSAWRRSRRGPASVQLLVPGRKC